MVKKTVIVALLLFVIPLTILSCGGEAGIESVEESAIGEVPEEEVAREEAVAEAEASSEGKIVIVFKSWAEDEFEQAALTNMIEAFENDNPNIEVETIIITSGGRQ